MSAASHRERRSQVQKRPWRKDRAPSQGKVCANERQDSEQKKAARFGFHFSNHADGRGSWCILAQPKGRGEHFIGCFSWTATLFSGHAHNSDHWHQASNRPPSAWLVAARARHPFGRELAHDQEI